MAERSTQKFTRPSDTPAEPNFPQHYKKRVAVSESFNEDELIFALSQSYENRRTAQAFEWESIRLSGLLSRGSVT